MIGAAELRRTSKVAAAVAAVDVAKRIPAGAEGNSVSVSPVGIVQPKAAMKSRSSYLGAFGALSVYCGSAMLVGAAMLAGRAGLSPADGQGWVCESASWEEALLNAAVQWDGVSYAGIACNGYTQGSAELPNTVFFPLYPLLAAAFHQATSADVRQSLILISHISLATAFVLFWTYLRRGSRAAQFPVSWVVLAFAFFPTTFFWRMAYTESLFILLCLLVLVGIQRQWPVSVVAIVVGAGTATRPVGVALLAPLALYGWRRGAGRAAAAARLMWTLPLGAWGLLAYAVFLWASFGDPLCFAKTQKQWRPRGWAPMSEKVFALASWEPIWSVYDPRSTAYWRRFDKHCNPFISLQFANPLYFVGVAALVAVGASKRWLNEYETLLGVCLLLIPYVFHSYEACMIGHGRYASVVVPVYIVLGQLLARLPAVAAGLVLAGFAAMLGIYSALFAAGYWLI